MAIQIILGLLYFGSTTAFNAFSGVGVIALTTAYAVPIVVSMLEGRKAVRTGSFYLGPFGLFANIVSVCWSLLAIPLFCMPSTIPIEAATMNYASKNCRVLHDALRLLFDKADKAGATFEVEKTELIHFHRGRKPLLDTITIQDAEVIPKPVVRWLGIWFDSGMTFRTHVEKRLTLANGALQRIQRIARQRRGLGLNALRQLYMACVSSVADYGSLLWFGRRSCQSLWEQYQKLQNRALATITGAFPRSPTKALEVEAALLPPERRHTKLAYQYALRFTKLPHNHPVKQAFTNAPRNQPALGNNCNYGLSQPPTSYPTQLQSLIVLLKSLSKSQNIEDGPILVPAMV
ncbi:hypothetical protein PG995_006297 [Apiospora arundinis]